MSKQTPRLIFWHAFRTSSNPTGTMSGLRAWLDSLLSAALWRCRQHRYCEREKARRSRPSMVLLNELACAASGLGSNLGLVRA